jgi:hypothetical protein
MFADCKLVCSVVMGGSGSEDDNFWNTIPAMLR